MLRILLFLFMGLFMSCTIRENERNEKQLAIRDSINHNYEISQDGNLELQRRLNAINLAFGLALKINKDTLFSKVLYSKNYLHFSLNQYDSLLFFNKILERHAKRSQDTLYLGRLYYLKGHYHDYISGKRDSAFYYYNLGRKNLADVQDYVYAGRISLRMGVVESNEGDYFGSKESVTEALEYLKRTNDTNYIAAAFNLLATNHRKLLNREDALKYYQEAIETTTSNEDQFKYRNNLAAVYIDDLQYEKAILILEELLINPIRNDIEKEYARVLDNKAYAIWLSDTNRLDILKQYYDALNMRKKLKDWRGQIASYTHLGEYFLNLNERRAIKFLDTVIQISKKQNIPKGELDALKFLMKVQKNNIDIRNRYILLNETLHNHELEVKTQFAKYRYDNEEAQKKVLQLEVSGANQALVLTKERTQKIGYLLGLIITILVIGFGTYYYRQRTKRLNEKAKYLEQQNKIEKLEAAFETEARLSRKVHDDFSGNIYQAMMLVENKANTTEALDVLEGVYNQSRDFSREINEVDTGENFEVKLFGMLQSYLLPEAKLYTKGLDKIHWQHIGRLEKMTIHKILQELMINMQKYSGAKRVTFVFTEDERGLRIIYTDNGQGATKEELNVKNGLQITEKRIQDVDGTIIFETEEGNGFKATLEIPK